MSINIKNVIQAICAALPSQPVFVYGTKNEINTVIDLATLGKPVVLMLGAAVVKTPFDPSGGIDNVYNFILQFMEQTTFGEHTGDVDVDAAVSRQFIAANQFQIKLRDYRSADGRKVFRVTPGKDAGQIQYGFDSYDANYSGVQLQINNLRAMFVDPFC